jgi:hypothetical protein
LIPALPYALDQVVLFGMQLCDLLDYLCRRTHPDTGEQQPVIHNDIKPANIIRDPETDKVWLVDFGTARARYVSAPLADKESVYGTVGYAAPEQYHGASEPRSDVYALGATLYHLLTDDDPRDHPFQFDRLDHLDLNLRLALRAALDPDVTTRSTALAFRESLNKCMPDQPLVEAQPLAFPAGKSAQKLSDLVGLAQQEWDYARDILYSGDLEHWLRRSLHNPVVAEVARRVTSSSLERDAGLDAFLREIAPTLPGGRLTLDKPAVNMGTVITGRLETARVVLSNNGRGYSQGTVTSSAAWLREHDGRFGVRPGGTDELLIEADTAQLAPGSTHRETLTVTPADNSKPLMLEVLLTVAEARVAVQPLELVFDLTAGAAQPQEFALVNTGGNPVQCQLSRDEPWLLVEPKRVSLAAGQSATGKVNIRPDRLPPAPRPRATVVITPDHGTASNVAVRVQTIGSRGARRRLGILLGLCTLAAVGLGARQLATAGHLHLSPSASLAPSITAEDLDAAMVAMNGLDIDRYEVTNIQYARYQPGHLYAKGDELLPAVNITWEAAREYCQQVNKRLPSETEWESVARGPDLWTYPWGNDPDRSRLNSLDNRSTGLVRVDSYAEGATPQGVHHLLGNASEWVVGSAEHPRTHRGGSYQDIGMTNSSSTYADQPGYRSETVGFRCVRPVTPAS